jgi:membrane-associated PAP2 superfamily phosphatase
MAALHRNPTCDGTAECRRMSRLDRTLWPAAALLAAVLLLCQCTPVDLMMQDHLFDFAANRWLIPRDCAVLEFTFHRLPKYLTILFGAVLLVWPLLRRRWRGWPALAPGVIAIAVLTPAATAALTGTLKSLTHSHCPWSVQRYGGAEPYVRPLSRYEACCPPTRKGACWPAGHASGGFGLVATATLAGTRRGRGRGLLFGLLAGWITGGYQMLKGAHYLSDTMVTMLLAWILHLLLRRVLLRGTERFCYPGDGKVKSASPS